MKEGSKTRKEKESIRRGKKRRVSRLRKKAGDKSLVYLKLRQTHKPHDMLRPTDETTLPAERSLSSDKDSLFWGKAGEDGK